MSDAARKAEMERLGQEHALSDSQNRTFEDIYGTDPNYKLAYVFGRADVIVNHNGPLEGAFPFTVGRLAAKYHVDKELIASHPDAKDWDREDWKAYREGVQDQIDAESVVDDDVDTEENDDW